MLCSNTNIKIVLLHNIRHGRNICIDSCNVIYSDQDPLVCRCGCKLYHCYECQNSQPESIMQKSDCTLCGGRKCFKHGGDLHTCEKCKYTGLCVDCLSFGSCCEAEQELLMIKEPEPD